MDARYRYATLPLDTPDDDPRWAEYLGVFQLGFLDRRHGEAAVDRFRRNKRGDGATLGMITAEGPGLPHRQPVAAYVSAPYRHNAGVGMVPTQVVNTIAVRPSHRRRGLLTEMMRHHLDGALARGCATAVLSASEATIYGRYGFGPATRRASFDIDAHRFRIRPEVAVADGTIEFCHPEVLGEDLVRVAAAYAERHRGAHGMLTQHRALALGEWDPTDDGPNLRIRAVGHWSDGRLDGFALYQHDGWDEGHPASITVHAVCSPEAAVERRLYQALIDIDLVERLKCFGPGPNDPLSLSLVDPWAVRVHALGDGVWLRVLDLPTAMAQRGFDSDGELVLAVRDRQGYAAGGWRLVVRDGRASVEATTDSPEVSLDVATLGPLYFGDRTVGDCARAGLVSGTPEALARTGRLFAVQESPANLAHF